MDRSVSNGQRASARTDCSCDCGSSGWSRRSGDSGRSALPVFKTCRVVVRIRWEDALPAGHRSELMSVSGGGSPKGRPGSIRIAQAPSTSCSASARVPAARLKQYDPPSLIRRAQPLMGMRRQAGAIGGVSWSHWSSWETAAVSPKGRWPDLCFGSRASGRSVLGGRNRSLERSSRRIPSRATMFRRPRRPRRSFGSRSPGPVQRSP
jgi:hypothetical protein